MIVGRGGKWQQPLDDRHYPTLPFVSTLFIGAM